MKVIDLLNIGWTKKEKPKKIKYHTRVYEYDKSQDDYSCFCVNHYEYLLDDINTFNQLSEEIEILEEVEYKEYSDIEEITIRDKTIGFPNGEWTARNMDKAFAIKINALIKNQKYILERIKKNEVI